METVNGEMDRVDSYEDLKKCTEHSVLTRSQWIS